MQNDFYTRVLSHLTEGTGRPERDRLMVAVVNEYIRSLVQFHIIVQHPIYEILIEGLVRLGQFYQLHQLFQYHAITDSKPLVTDPYIVTVPSVPFGTPSVFLFNPI